MWQKGHWTWILEIVLPPPSRATLDKSPSMEGLRQPWPGGFLSAMWCSPTPWAGVACVTPQGGADHLPSLEDAVSDLGKVGAVGPPAQPSVMTEHDFKVSGRGPGRY